MSGLFFRQQFRSGDIIFSEGDPGDCAYVIEHGRVEITTVYAENTIVLARPEAGELFGEIALIDGGPRTATAKAMEDCTLMVMTDEQVESRIQHADPVLGWMLRVLLDHCRNERTKLLQRFAQFAHVQVSAPKVRARAFQTSAIASIQLESELRQALERNEFLLHYQPIVDLKSGFIEGFEALIRWQHPKRGLLTPIAFIHALEQSTLMIPIGQWIVREVCRNQALFQQASASATGQEFSPFMNLNISGRQLHESGFADQLTAIVEETGADPGKIKLEITESLMIDATLALDWIKSCKNAGFQIVLDDFGMGYSNLSYLHLYPFDMIKIDKSFVFSMIENRRSMLIIDTMIRLASAMGMDVVAEGIESSFEMEKLRDMGCTYGQGYWLSRPMSLEKALAFIRHSRQLIP